MLKHRLGHNPDRLAPAAPSDLSATAASDSQLNLSWTDNAADETAFLVERSPSRAGDWSQIANLGANSIAYSDTALRCGTTYYYRVQVYQADDGHYSDYSTVIDAEAEMCELEIAGYLPLLVKH